MKTSNKILIGFFAVVFLIPVMAVMSFKRKISKGRFTVELQENQGSNFRSGNFAGYKVIKLVSPGDRLLKVNITTSDSLYYSYHMMGDDSLRISNVGDTLMITYDRRATQVHNSQSELNLKLKLPSLAELVIDNADITLDSLNKNAQANISATISNDGRLKVGTLIEEVRYENRTEEIDFPYNLQTLNVAMNGGELLLGSKTTIQQLKLNAEGSSVLAIKEGAYIGATSGRLSGESSIKANWKYVKSLSTLASE